MAQGTCRHPDGCARPARKLGWCSMHYNRLRTTGDLGPAEKLTRWGEQKGQSCSVDGCDAPAALKSWCRFHYDRVRFTGSPGSVEPKRRRLPTAVRTWSSGERHRFYKYGLTPEAFSALLTRQNGECACCGTDEPLGKGWSVDHCHVSGKVRWILCNNCNAALGLIGENAATAKRLYEMCCEITE